VRDCMLPRSEVPVFHENDDAAEALAGLSEPGQGRGLVVSNGHLEGIVSAADLARALDVRQRARPAAPR
jgi:CBS domain-containing protein